MTSPVLDSLSWEQNILAGADMGARGRCERAAVVQRLQRRDREREIRCNLCHGAGLQEPQCAARWNRISSCTLIFCSTIQILWLRWLATCSDSPRIGYPAQRLERSVLQCASKTVWRDRNYLCSAAGLQAVSDLGIHRQIFLDSILLSGTGMGAAVGCQLSEEAGV